MRISQLAGSLFAVMLLFSEYSALAQVPLAKRKQLLIGTWSFCQSVEKLDTTGLCAGSNYNWYYVFTANGKFYQSQSGIKSPGKWQLTNAELTLDLDDTPTSKRYPYTNPVTWISENLFYYTGQEGPKGPLVFSYYRRIKSDKTQSKL